MTDLQTNCDRYKFEYVLPVLYLINTNLRQWTPKTPTCQGAVGRRGTLTPERVEITSSYHLEHGLHVTTSTHRHLVGRRQVHVSFRRGRREARKVCTGPVTVLGAPHQFPVSLCGRDL